MNGIIEDQKKKPRNLREIIDSIVSTIMAIPFVVPMLVLFIVSPEKAAKFARRVTDTL